jgi:hypothetical protein
MGEVVAKPADADTPAQSFPQRLLGVFISPGETFEDVARRPGFWAPLITIVVGALAVIETMLWKIGLERIARMQLEQSGQASRMSPDQIDQALRLAVRVGGITTRVFGILGPPIVLLIIAGLGLLILNPILGAQAKFKTVFSLVCYADLVSLLGSLMAVAMILFGDPEQFNVENPVPSNVGFFLNPREVSKPLYSLASSADILTIWLLILLGVGLSKATGGKVKPLPIFLLYVGIWLVWVLGKAGLKLIM